MICIPDCIAGRAEGTTRGLKLSKTASGHDTLHEEDRLKRLCHNGLQQIAGNCGRDFLALITRRSEGQVLPPQPYRADVTDFSYIRFFIIVYNYRIQSGFTPAPFLLPSLQYSHIDFLTFSRSFTRSFFGIRPAATKQNQAAKTISETRPTLFEAYVPFCGS